MIVKAKPPTCVIDLMCPHPVTIQASASPRELARLLLEHGISGVPVIDQHRRVIGVVSKTDLLQWCVKGGLGFGARDLLVSLAEGTNGTRIEPVDLGIVADFMSAEPVTINPGQSLVEAARLMAGKRIHRLVVVDGKGVLQGVITSLDLLRAYPTQL